MGDRVLAGTSSAENSRCTPSRVSVGNLQHIGWARMQAAASRPAAGPEVQQGVPPMPLAVFGGENQGTDLYRNEDINHQMGGIDSSLAMAVRGPTADGKSWERIPTSQAPGEALLLLQEAFRECSGWPLLPGAMTVSTSHSCSRGNRKVKAATRILTNSGLWSRWERVLIPILQRWRPRKLYPQHGRGSDGPEPNCVLSQPRQAPPGSPASSAFPYYPTCRIHACACRLLTCVPRGLSAVLRECGLLKIWSLRASVTYPLQFCWMKGWNTHSVLLPSPGT